MRAELSFLLVVLVIGKDFSEAFATLTTGASTGIPSTTAALTSKSAVSTVVTTPTSFLQLALFLETTRHKVSRDYGIW